ncbi:SCP2 domain-containing protein [Aggregatibacter actinomycetemcomitans]|nr:SCP2 domain-containing protein [Aggregatibacter actinomycetemcomitans]
MLFDLSAIPQQLMLPQLLNSGLETVLNHLLQRTAHYEPYLRKLADKSLQVSIKGVQTTFYFLFSEQRIDVLHQYEAVPDCAVTINPNLLFTPLKKAQISQWINDKSIVLEGDLQVLQDFAALVEFLEKDPAELLSPYVGDIAAQSAVNFLRKIVAIGKQKISQSQRYWGERLTEEWQVISPSLALADFGDQVKTLEKQTALLEQKINRLMETQ